MRKRAIAKLKTHAKTLSYAQSLIDNKHYGLAAEVVGKISWALGELAEEGEKQNQEWYRKHKKGQKEEIDADKGNQ